MIKLTHLNGKEFVVNADMIQFIECTPDTLIILSTGHKIMVAESIDEVVEKVVEYRKSVLNGLANAHLHIIRREESPKKEEEQTKTEELWIKGEDVLWI